MRRIEKAVILAASLLYLGCLALFAYAGAFTRYWADDYCYSAVLKQYGAWGGIVDWYIYSGNRFSAVASVAVLDGLGPANVAILPPVMLVFWVLAWLFFLKQLFLRLFRWQISRRWLFLLSLVQVLFGVLLAPDRLQTIYWRMGVLHYTLPLPLMLVLLGWTVGNIRRPVRDRKNSALWLLLASFGTSFFAAGQSETFAMLQIGVLGMGLLVGLFFCPDTPRAQAAIWWGVPLVSSLLVIIVMFLSPSLSSRLAVMPAPTNIWLVVPYTLRYVTDFIFYSIRGQIVPFGMYFFSITAIALTGFRPSSQAPEMQRLTLRKSILGMAFSVALAFTLIAFSFTPSAYANLQYPAGRALMPASFILLTGLASFAFFFAAAVRRLPFPAYPEQLRLAGLFLLLGLSLYPLRAVRIPLDEIRVLAVWADRWDARDAQIWHDIAAGNSDIVVKQIEVVRTLEDMGPNPKHWINNCASIYYGVQSISAYP